MTVRRGEYIRKYILIFIYIYIYILVILDLGVHFDSPSQINLFLLKKIESVLNYNTNYIELSLK